MTPTEEMVRVAQRAYTDALIEGGLPMRSALSAALAAMWQDHVIVPREPSREILHEFWDGLSSRQQASISRSRDHAGTADLYRHFIRAVISATPTQLSTRTNERDDARNLSGVSSE